MAQTATPSQPAPRPAGRDRRRGGAALRAARAPGRPDLLAGDPARRRLVAEFCRSLGRELRGAGAGAAPADAPPAPVLPIAATAADTGATPRSDDAPPSSTAPAVARDAIVPGATTAAADAVVFGLPPLSRRTRQTLDLLLDGDGEKQIARKLRISPHTVHAYVKALYKRFDVNSRSELLARWVRK